MSIRPPSTRPSLAATLTSGAAIAVLAGLVLTGGAHPGTSTPDRHLGGGHLRTPAAHSTVLDWSGGCGGAASYNRRPC
ncbi:hypothetical protein [Herbiconiux ginsengi]|uniref:Uncharacterized protein n=1 Tax=Herbiconiux ginsengi TaxID=381665 RepID=A0A1H3QPP7_9MICO|nr:hypothetical protein [Herbiconiux ginsengi]SDZ14689.1 hypothetical protein SAMN05216554_2630 [Herbiconiux ginsengi]